MTAIPNEINESPRGADLVTPVKAHGCHAHAALRDKSRHGSARSRSGASLMRRGVERC
ncbi:hypothetical protein [Mycobacterium asiaticum]|uniref:hypothetical protein n=1 Tax=Mycobacterium asiaticum TaxID=1790 RepID=UPI0012DB3F1E|nr:hypothetical protein [Mycobacterium asiaticum]